MAGAYGIELDPAWPALNGLHGCFFRFRLVEWRGNWLIDKFRRCDPFEVSDGIAELEAYLKEAGDEVS